MAGNVKRGAFEKLSSSQTQQSKDQHQHQHHSSHNHRQNQHNHASAELTLNRAKAGKQYRLTSWKIDSRTRHKLETLGLTANSPIEVISNTALGSILNVKESRLAIGNDLARRIIVEPLS